MIGNCTIFFYQNQTTAAFLNSMVSQDPQEIHQSTTSQANSIPVQLSITPTAKFIDHVLQPLAQSYPDYLHNSIVLSLLLQSLSIPDDAILVTLDVNSLYPLILLTEMLQVVYEEMIQHRHLLLFDPNLIVQLLHTNINHNYFEFASLIFQQIRGTAMGAAFSPTVANIYMSVVVRRFLRTQKNPSYYQGILMIFSSSGWIPRKI